MAGASGDDAVRWQHGVTLTVRVRALVYACDLISLIPNRLWMLCLFGLFFYLSQMSPRPCTIKTLLCQCTTVCDRTPTLVSRIAAAQAHNFLTPLAARPAIKGKGKRDQRRNEDPRQEAQAQRAGEQESKSEGEQWERVQGNAKRPRQDARGPGARRRERAESERGSSGSGSQPGSAGAADREEEGEGDGERRGWSRRHKGSGEEKAEVSTRRLRLGPKNPLKRSCCRLLVQFT